MRTRDIFTTLCLVSGQTERAANRLGVRPFLPELFRLRCADMTGLEPDTFAAQMGA